jgi:nucleotide-binding universal stress UspA family protein
MPMQILVPLHTYPDGNATGLAGHVGDVAQHLKADVHALAMIADFPPLHSPLAGIMIDVPSMIDTARTLSRKNAASLMSAIGPELAARSVPLRSTEVAYYPTELADIVSDRARYHDLCLLGVGEHDVALRGTAQEVVFAAGRPVLLVPEDLESFSTYDHVAIAWDGSRVAARGVADAAQFLAKATAVTILCVRDEKPLPGDDIGQRLAVHLEAHGIKATVLVIETGERPIADTLQAEARKAGAGLLAMGGFGHSRMRDFILGGATSGIFRTLTMPVLVSH